jgi:hypothetical protein
VSAIIHAGILQPREFTFRSFVKMPEAWLIHLKVLFLHTYAVLGNCATDFIEVIVILLEHV